MKTQKLWNRDFSLLIAGQIISIFGNMILSMALPLYILDISDAAFLFGLVLAVPYVSLLLISPIGGIIADRLKKQYVMFWLDLSTTVIIVLYMLSSGLFAEVIPLVMVKLLALNAIQGIYMPTVQSAVPLLAPQDKFVQANSAVTVVNSLSSFVAPAVAGVLFYAFGLFPILVISAVCFGVTAVVDLFIQIPFTKQKSYGSIFNLVKNDLGLALRFIFKGNPVLVSCVAVVFVFTLTVSAVLVVGLPVIIVRDLGMGMNMVGISHSVMAVGGLLGGLIAGALGARLTIRKIHLPLLFSGLAVLPLGLVFLVDVPYFVAFVIVTASSAFTIIGMQIFTIMIMSFVQSETPPEIIGKVLSVLVMLPFLAGALGQFLFGALFEFISVWIIVFVVSIIAAAVALYKWIFFQYYYGRFSKKGI